MNHLPPMIIDLAIILCAAAVSTIIFSKLRQPIVLGYLIAGFAVGPHFPLWPTVIDKQGVTLWAEIGVIFLLFSLGLEFSFKKLAKVGRSAFIAATFEIITMSGLGYLLGRALGWTTMDSIYLGAILSMSSTTIIIRALSETGFKTKAFASLVFGILIVEDLLAILMMVILTAISTPGNFSGSTIALLSTRLVFFLVIWYAVGIYLVPTLFKRVRRHLSNEIMLIVSIGLCFMMVVLATKANFSAAIGAFIMGSILAETEEGERIEHLLGSVKDLFAAVFFVSVGMMIDPGILKEHFWVVLAITALTIVGKLLGSGFGAVLSGRSLKHSTQAGMSLAQIGEFSFIIATLGLSLNVISSFLYPIIIAVSAVTTFTTPYMIRYSGPFYGWLEPRLPKKFVDRLNQYERAMSEHGKEGALKLIWRTYGVLLTLNAIVALGISLGAAKFALPFLIDTFGDNNYVRLIACIATLVACSPFLFAIVLRAPKSIVSESAENLLRLSRLQFGLTILRSILGLILIETIVSHFTRTRTLPIIILLAAPALIYFCRRYIARFYSLVENRFLQNLNAKEIAEVESLAKLPQLAPWNATLVEMKMSSDSTLAGLTIEESKFRSVTGATIAMIDRGQRRLFAPNRSVRLLPDDQLFLIGTEEQVIAARKLLQPDVEKVAMAHDENFNLEYFVVGDDSQFSLRTIREIDLQNKFNVLVIGIERETNRILNPESTIVLQPADIVWVFGDRSRIKELQNTDHSKVMN